jgi:hypothetical protein
VHLGWTSSVSTPCSATSAWQHASHNTCDAIQRHLRSALGSAADLSPCSPTISALSTGCSTSTHDAAASCTFPTIPKRLYAEHSRCCCFRLGAYWHQRQSCRLRSRQTGRRISATRRFAYMGTLARPQTIQQTLSSPVGLCIWIQQLVKQRSLRLRRSWASLSLVNSNLAQNTNSLPRTCSPWRR